MAREQIEIEAVYAGYLDRQAADVEAFRRDEDLRLPADLDYGLVGSLSNEVREKLARVQPLDPRSGGPDRRGHARRPDRPVGPCPSPGRLKSAVVSPRRHRGRSISSTPPSSG